MSRSVAVMRGSPSLRENRGAKISREPPTGFGDLHFVYGVCGFFT